MSVIERLEPSPARHVFRSSRPAPAGSERSLPDFVLRHAERLGSRPAMLDAAAGRSLSYAALADYSRRAAAGLAARGFGPGDVLGLHAPNLPEYPVAFLGAALAGGAVTTASPLCTADELAGQLGDARARVLVTVPAFLATAEAAAARAGVDELLVLGDAPSATPFTSLLDAGADPPAVALGPDDPVALPYSSGTTGVPKGVVLTHGSMVCSLEQIAAHVPFSERDTVLAVAPFFHALGLIVMLLHGLARGATVVSLPRFELEPFLAAIQEHRVTKTIVVPPIILALAQHPAVERYDLSSLELVGSGAAPLDPALEQAAAERLGCPVAQGYGMTETSGTIAVSRFDEPGRLRRGSVGELMPGTEARIVDPATGDDRGPGETGELWARGPQLMPGYLGRPAETAATIDDDGWLHTGDLATIDEDGYVWIVDRLKELIKYKGYQVAPAQLEALLLGHPAVLDAAVVGRPDPQAGEVPVAYVVARGEADPDAIRAWVAERVAPYKRLAGVELVDEIPKSPSGKILRRVLVERERARAR